MSECVCACRNEQAHGHGAPLPERTTQPSLGGRQASRWMRAVRRAEGLLVEEAHVAEGSQSRGPIPPESLGKLPRHDV